MEGERFADLVFKGYEREVLEVLLDQPDDSFTVNEVAEETSASYNSVKSFLNRLREYGIVRFERKGSYRLVTYDSANRYHDLLIRIFTVDDTARREAAERYAEELCRRHGREIRSVALFGSTARGTASKDSDIDVLVLVRDRDAVESVERRAGSLADRFAREQRVRVSTLVMEEEQFRGELENGAPLQTNIREEGIVLEGETPW